MTRDRGPDRPGRLARLALRAYPEAFRRRHGADYLRFLDRQRAEPRYARRPFGPVRFWLGVGRDAVVAGLGGRLREAVPGRGGRGGGGWRIEITATLRGLARAPFYSFTVAATLALGIGAATAAFGIADWISYRPVPGARDHDALVTVRFQHESRPGGWFLVSYPDFMDLKEASPAFAELAAVQAIESHVALGPDAAPRRVFTELVTSGYFRVFGTPMELGRAPEPSTGEDPRVVAVSYAFWRGEMEGDPAVVGSVLTLNGQPFTVVGVAAPDFHGPAPAERRTDIWMPAEAHPWAMPTLPEDLLTRRSWSQFFTLYGRLRPDTGPSVAGAQLIAAREAILEAHGTDGSLGRFVPVLEERVGVAPWVRERAAAALPILLAAGAMLVLLGCANAGNLLLARAAGRAHAYRIRRALGATRRRIAGPMLTEGLVLGAVGGGLGLLLARLLLGLHGGERFLGWLPTLDAVPVDGRTAAFAMGLALATGAVFSVVPAWLTAGRADPRPYSGVRVAGGLDRVRRMMVAAQVVFSLALIVTAGLLLESVRTLAGIDVGFDAAGVVEATLDPGTHGYAPADRDVFWRDAIESARAIPGVTAAGLAAAPLLGMIASDTEVWTPERGRDAAVDARNIQVTDGFLAAAGVPLLAGRDFRPDEIAQGTDSDVVIVSESLARRVFEGAAEAAVGRRLETRWPEGRSFEVIGVTGDIRHRSVKDPEPHLLVQPFGQTWNHSRATLYVRGSGGSEDLAAAVRRQVAALDPSLPPYDVQPLAARVRSSYAEERLLARLTTVFGTMALLLAGLGLYGVMSHAVVARSRELGVRIALGAEAGRVRSMVLRQGVLLVALGLPPGLLLAAASSHLVASRLWGVTPFDLRVWGVGAGVLLVAGALASWLPAWRATRIDPREALRAE